jgi:hypothetical protein
MRTPVLRLEGSIRDRLGHTGAPAVLIEAWDAQEQFPEVLATAISDKAGTFVLQFDEALLQKAFASRPPKVKLRLFMNGSRLAFAPSDQEYTPGETHTPMVLTVTIPAPYAGDNLFLHIPPELRAELDALRKHTPTVLERLRDDKARKAFLENPAQALAAMRIPLSPQLRQRLISQPPPPNLLTPRAFRLLNGQIVAPKVNIRFTDGKEGSHGR